MDISDIIRIINREMGPNVKAPETEEEWKELISVIKYLINNISDSDEDSQDDELSDSDEDSQDDELSDSDEYSHQYDELSDSDEDSQDEDSPDDELSDSEDSEED